MPGSEECKKNLDRYGEALLAGIYLLSQHRAMLMEADAKIGAPWTDRTGNARSGLFGEVMAEKEAIKTRIAHSVEYGPYLELANSKKYAILEPTAQKHAPEYFTEVEKLVRGT